MDLFKKCISKSTEVISSGLMSGTSLDGLDIALCRFRKEEQWTFELLDATTIKYDDKLKKQLQNAGDLSAYEFIRLHKDYGRWTGEQVNSFLKNKNVPVDLISSHGHTVFHEPEKNLNFQLGDGAMIAATTGITTVSDFRTMDITLGGQGAPLIPIVDRDLFGNYDACINIGGFANISLDINSVRKAWDICPANIVLNRLAAALGSDHDMDGKTGRSGKVITGLLNKLEHLDHYSQDPPKSLGTEWLDKNITPLIEAYAQNHSVSDIMATFYEHISSRISFDLNRHKVNNALFTGGGVKNGYLMQLIKNKFDGELIVPGVLLVDFKEAIGFAYLGILRATGSPNCLSSVTGAKHDCSSGVIDIY